MAKYGDFIYNSNTSVLTSYSIGVDCSGFMSQSANYNNNSYDTVKDLPQGMLEWGSWPTSQLMGPSGYDSASYTISEQNRSKLKPGDFIYKPGHVAIILRIEEGTEELDKRIYLLESAFDSGKYKVINLNTIFKYRNYTNFRTKRFK
ncbi:hypothetical protein EW093_05555 [Thiospirochaeta perfilievii]|uniref:NlpC/P60 domain-containing protein n=1 Tax=Thiospirochaeta perfilievii TaxID=252967 RepID=A0A5C1Q9N1_9SPIO|nr:hypothetical protein [Thiospirochaeta perfilievii]QEN04191.1 hypothetical protein EW093_05555 [Thiospirochaeta perfilievii]